MLTFRACFSMLWIVSMCYPDSLVLQQQSAGSPPQTKDSSAPVLPKPAPAFSFGLEDGTAVSLTLARELSSAKESAGNRVDFVVVDDVKVNGIVVIPKGGTAWGTVVDAKPGAPDVGFTSGSFFSYSVWRVCDATLKEKLRRPASPRADTAGCSREFVL